MEETPPKKSSEKIVALKEKLSPDKLITRSVDFIFSKDSRKWVLLMFVIGFILRTLVALRLKFDADEMIYVPQTIHFIEAGKLQIYNQCAIWYWFTDLFNHIFGVNVLGARFFAVLLGSLSIILVYLLGKKIFNEKIGILAAFIFTLSPFQLAHTIGEMDIPMSFFAFLSFYLLILFLEKEKKSLFILAWITLGIAIMVKPIALLFIPAFCLFMLCYNKKHHDDFRWKQILYAALIIIIMVAPVLTYNYLLYKDKGLVDMQFARFTRIGFDFYSGIASTIEPFSLKVLTMPTDGALPGFIRGLEFFWTWGLKLTLLLSAVGLFYIFKQKNKYRWPIAITLVIPFIFLAGTSLLSKHFIFMDYFISILSALAIFQIIELLKNEKTRKILFCGVIALILILSLVKVYTSPYPDGLFGENELGKMIDFKDKNIESNALIIGDSRIYAGRTAFMFWDRPYLDSLSFLSILQDQANIQGADIPVQTYFIEAVQDDSGWGISKLTNETNITAESVVSLFSKTAEKVGTIEGINGQPHFNVYKKLLSLKQVIYTYASNPREWFYYPVGYAPVSKNFDNYEVYNTFDMLLNKLAHLVLYLELLLTAFLMCYLLYLFAEKPEQNK